MFRLLFITLAFCVVKSASADDAFENNDTFADAVPISYGVHLGLALEGDDVVDWFRVNAGPGMLYLEMEHDTPDYFTSGGLNMTLFDSQMRVVKADFSSTNIESFQFHVTVPGDYFFKIQQVAPKIGNTYSLTVLNTRFYPGDDVNDSGGANDNFSTAKAIDVSEQVVNQKSFDDDWFRVDLFPGQVEIDLNYSSGSGGNIDLAVHNSSGARVAASVLQEGNAATSNGRSIQLTVPAQDEYRIVAYGESGTTYSLSIESSTVWVAEYEYGPIRSSSATVFDIDGDGKDEILIGTSKGLNASFDEVRPAALLCIEHDGSLKWATQFPAMPTADIQTGKTYTTTSVSSTPSVGDIDQDGVLDIVVGVGADTRGEAGPNVVGQPGDRGGVYALNAADGSIKWFHQSIDQIGGAANVGDGRPDGVYSTPQLKDVDKNGDIEVVYGGWDQRVWVLDGRSGAVETGWPRFVLDTVWSTPYVGDFTGTGSNEVLIGADITENTDARTQTGGIFHVFDRTGEQNISGFDQFIGNPNYSTLIGKYEEEVLWSSPAVADFDGSPGLEVAYGTGNFQSSAVGSYIRVWNANGSLKFRLNTQGKTFASPVFADLTGDGSLELIATTLDGYVYAWNNRGEQVFGVATIPFGATTPQPIFSSPLAVDVDADGLLEVVYAQGAQITIVNHLGMQISDRLNRELITEEYTGSPAVKDVDGDGRLDFISGGSNSARDRAVVYRWHFRDHIGNGTNNRYSKRQFNEPKIVNRPLIQAFVTRLYQNALNRAPDAAGLTMWTNFLSTNARTGLDSAVGFFFSDEFRARNLDNSVFLNTLYRTLFDRVADDGGRNFWLARLEAGLSRESVVNGFVFSTEFVNLSNRFGTQPYSDQQARIFQIQGFVSQFYVNVLQRQPDVSGLNDWTVGLANETRTGADIANGFFFSQELISRSTTNEVFVELLYKSMFDRQPDDQGRAFWVDHLNQGMPRTVVVSGFVNAAEFSSLCARFAIQC